MVFSGPHSLKRKNHKHLQLNPESLSASSNAGGGIPSDDLHLLVGCELDLHVQGRDLEHIKVLGHGNGGVVAKVRHTTTGLLMAKKTIYLEARPEIRRSIMQELDTLKICDSERIVKYYGQFMEENAVIICMEFMDRGSLDKIVKHTGPLPEDIIAGINAEVVDGLQYLKQLNITHRDIKPSNILVNSQGNVKICDFGVSRVLINSIAETFVGTSTYMSPERISGMTYSATSDVWSLGLTLVELAKGTFPFKAGDSDEGGGGGFAIFDLLQQIVNDPPPTPPEWVSPTFRDYVSSCLTHGPERRMHVEHLSQHNFYAYGRSLPRHLIPQWASQLPRS